jgi:transcriptional regulator with XRE-family HTH domain
MMKGEMSTNRSWLLKMSDIEGGADIAVGGLAYEVGLFSEAEAPAPHANKAAFANLIALRRREQRLTIEQLAEKADVELSDLYYIERGEFDATNARTVYKLATTLNLPEQSLMKLAGLTVGKDATFDQEAVRFAARSQSVDKLSREEHRVLEEYVKFLAQK